MVKVALPNKGRLFEDVKNLFEDAGLPFRGRSERSLTAVLHEGLEAIFVRAQDIPEFVADGAAEVGITGRDLIVESERDLHELLDLEFGRCRLVVAAKEDGPFSNLASLPPRTKVATCFPKLTARYFQKAGLAVDVVPVSGAAEIAPHLGIADIVVDLTSTGSTLRVNGLREMGTVLESSARLVARPDSASKKPIHELALALESVLRARSQRYVMANAPRENLDKVRECLPGLNGPTLSQLLDKERFVAIHAVVPAAAVYRTISQLKAAGCEGILVTRIERLVP